MLVFLLCVLFSIARGLCATLGQTVGSYIPLLLCAELVKFGVSLLLSIGERPGGAAADSGTGGGDRKFEMVEYGQVPSTDTSLDGPASPVGRRSSGVGAARRGGSVALCDIVRSHLSWYCIPALFSFVADALVVALLQNDIHGVRFAALVQAASIPLASTLMRHHALPNRIEWSAIILVGAALVVSTEDAARALALGVGAVWALPVGIFTSLYVATCESMYTSPAWAAFGIHKQNTILFGIRCAFLLAAVPADAGNKMAKLRAQWGASELGFVLLHAIDGLLMPQVLASTDAFMYVLLTAVGVSFYVATTFGVSLLWACGVVVTLVAGVLLHREHSVRRIVDESGRIEADDDLP